MCKISIPIGANKIIHTLQKNGYSAYAVGGCVRDSILGKIPHDWDICTSATPNEMLEIFKDKRIIETGLQHGTITVMIDNEGYEVTTFRIDGEYSDNRHPDSVSFTNDLVEDLKRRDFTINAMAYNDEEGLIDPFGGIEDIEYKKIRCVGSAKERFNEDALRMLRAIRFSSQLDFSIEPETSYEIHKMYTHLCYIAAERINCELCKIVTAADFPVELILFSDVFSYIIPELKPTINFSQNNKWHIYDVFYHTVHALADCKSDDLITRLAILLHDIGKPCTYQQDKDGVGHFPDHAKVGAEKIDWRMRLLKFDNDTREKVVQLVRYHDTVISPRKCSIKAMLNIIGKEQFRRLLDVQMADNKAQNQEYAADRIKELKEIEELFNEIIQNNECYLMKDLAIGGNDLMNAGYVSGKELGNTLRILLQLVIEGQLDNKKEKLLEVAKWLLEN